ncbi:MAG TPA: extracellular solute-binding protein [Chloroflexota bacterium]|nr:extracellular solute-binding protein [Chloroflexota bacterium]
MAAGVLLAACGSAGSPASSPAAASGTAASASAAGGTAASASWDETVAAAKQEGTLVLTMSPGDTFRDWIADFQKAYPGINVQLTQQNGGDFVSRITPERQSGKFLWDAYAGGAETAYKSLRPAGFLDPLRPVIVRPELLDDSKWIGGFQAGFVDKDGQYVYDVEADVIPTVHVNRDVLPENQLSQVEDITDPKWKGKLAMFDPRIAGNGSATAGHLVMVKGEDWWRQVLAQQPAITSDYRQEVEWLVRGQYPIALAANNRIIPEFQKQGLGQNVKPLAFDSDMGHRLNQSIALGAINQRPHPNAAAVFVNWAMSQEAQTSFVNATQLSSRRIDVPAGMPGTAPDPKVKYLPSVNQESSDQYISQAQQIAKEGLQ